MIAAGIYVSWWWGVVAACFGAVLGVIAMALAASARLMDDPPERDPE